jgi:hypothetical protein
MATIAVPWPGFTGFVIFIPSGAFTGVTGGTTAPPAYAIGVAFQAVVGQALMMVFDGALWWPSAVD